MPVPPGPCALGGYHSCVLGQRVPLTRDVGWGVGDREEATKGCVCGLKAGLLLKADLLWLDCRKQMLISSRRGSDSLPPKSVREEEQETEFSCCPKIAIIFHLP